MASSVPVIPLKSKPKVFSIFLLIFFPTLSFTRKRSIENLQQSWIYFSPQFCHFLFLSLKLRNIEHTHLGLLCCVFLVNEPFIIEMSLSISDEIPCFHSPLCLITILTFLCLLFAGNINFYRSVYCLVYCLVLTDVLTFKVHFLEIVYIVSCFFIQSATLHFKWNDQTTFI